MEKQRFWFVLLFAELALGIVIGLIYTWYITPVQYYDTAPDRLRADLKEDYILLIGEAYASDGDWEQAQRRLATLGLPDPAETVREITERSIARGDSIASIRNLATMAQMLGVESPSLAPFAPTREVEIEIIKPTLTATSIPPSPAAPTQTPTPTATPIPTITSLPTYTPQATVTPRLHFRLVIQQSICDPQRAEPLLQILVQDAEGDEMSGVEVIVAWETGSDRIFTGFKPELGRGYADMVLNPDESYTVHLAEGSEEVSGIVASPCESRAGMRFISTRLIFQELGDF